MQKRSIAVGIAFAAVIWGGGLAPAMAETSTSSVSTLMTQLEQQIADLKAKIEAARLAQTGVSQAAQNVGATLKLLKQLREGMTSDDVMLLQSLLAANASIYPEGKITGFYGKLTAEAVRRFQKKNGLEGVGFVGPRTLEKLNRLLQEHPLSAEDDEDDSDEDGDRHEKRICAASGNIAPGWLRKITGIRQIVSECRKQHKDERKNDDNDTDEDEDHDDDNRHGTTTSDTSAPLISNVNVSGVGSTTAAVNWTTNEEATSKVYYGTTTPINLGSALSASQGGMAILHSVPLTGLATSTTYYYVVEAKDAVNNIATSSQSSFTTLAL